MAKENSSEEIFKEALSKEFYTVIKGVILTEKHSRLIDEQNKLTFKVSKICNKSIVKVLVENEFNEEVKKVNIINGHDGVKRAIVTFKRENAASDIASKLGVL